MVLVTALPIPYLGALWRRTSLCSHSPFSLSTALSPEEAESALEATHYFTEDSSSEGECHWTQ